MRWTERPTAPAPPMEWRIVLALLALILLVPAALWPQPALALGSALALGLAAFSLSPVRTPAPLLLLAFAGLSLLLGVLLLLPLRWLLQAPELLPVLAIGTALALCIALAWRMVLPLGLLQNGAVKPGSGSDWLRSWRLARVLRQTQPLAHEGLGPAVALSLFTLLALAPTAPDLPAGARWLAVLLQVPLLLAGAAGPRHLARLVLIAEPLPGASGRIGVTKPMAGAAADAGTGECDPVEALYEATRNGRVEDALARVEAGVDVHALPAPDWRDQRSLAMLAAVLPDLRLLRLLIARGVDPNRRHGGLTPLLAATRDSHQGRPDAVMTLLANGADPDAVDAEGRAALHYAALAAAPEVAALLLDGGARPDLVDREGLSPLGRACASGNWRLARFLLERGAATVPPTGQPALVPAAAGEDDPVGVRLLLKHRAAVNATGPLQRGALHAAALAGNAAIVRVLLQAGAEVDARDAHGVTPLMEAVRSGAEAVVEALAARKPDANARDASGRSVLAIACRSRTATPVLLRRLLELGADPERRDEAGHRPIDDAVAQGRWPLVALLDPAYPLPTSVCHDTEAESDDARAEAAAAEPHAGDESSDSVAQVLELAARNDRPALRRWFGPLSGIEPLADDGEPLLLRLLDTGGRSLPAIEVLLERGVPCGGGGGLGRYLAACAAALDTSRLHENLALALLVRGADAFASCPDGEPVLHEALRLGWLRLVEALLEAGLDPDQRDAHGWTGLYLATNLGLEPAVRLLVRFGPELRARAADGQTAIGLALAGGREDLARWLDWSGPWSLPARRLRPDDLVAAALADDVAAVERLLGLGLPIDASDTQGCTALLRAAGQGHVAVVRSLLARGADPTLSARTGATPLTAAVSAGRSDALEALLDAGVAVDQPLPGGATALMVACALGQDGAARSLLAHGARIDLRDEQENTALLAAAEHAAVVRAREPVLSLLRNLLAAGAEIEARNAQGCGALHLVLGGRQEPGVALPDELLAERVGLLLGAGSRLDAQDRRGFTPLHLAALHGLNRCVSGLLAAGAQRAALDALGRSPRDLALLRGFVDIAAELAAAPAAPSPSLARFLRPPSA